MNTNEQFRFGSAAWSDKPELNRAGLLGNRGMVIGRFDKQDLRLETDAPFLTIGGAGSGKMRDLLSTAIAFNAGKNNFVLDPRGEIFAVTMPAFAFAGAHAFGWNPMGMHGLPMNRINPLDILCFGSPHFHADCKLIATSIIPTSGAANGRYFEMRAAEWTENILKALVELEGQTSFPRLYRIINIIESDTNAWADFLERMFTSTMDSVRRTAGEMLAKQQDSPREFGSIMGEIYAHLSFLDHPALQGSLENPDVSYRDTCRGDVPRTIFHNVPIEYVPIWSPLLRTMFTVQMLYKSRAPGAPPIHMIVDEAGQLGSFDSLLRAFTFGRGAGVRAWALFQDAGQIIRNFGDTALQGFIGSAAMRQFFGVRDYQTAQMISAMLGTETLEYDDTLRQADARRQKMHAAMRVMNGDDPFSAYGDLKYHTFAQDHRTKQARALMTPDEILAMPEDRQILFISGKNLRPVFAEKTAYTSRHDLIGRFLAHPYHGPQDRIDVPGRWGTRTLRIIRERVPPKFAHLPQYAAGTWAYVEGHKPT